jgi:serine phosphatase RsbU (regulator of sigma subunit)
VRARPPQDEVNARFSGTIVRQCLDTAEAFLSTNAPADHRLDLVESVLDAGIRCVMCAPLVAGGAAKAFGVIQLDTQEQRKKFTSEDLKLLCGVADQAAIALENAHFHAERLANEVLKKELDVAAQVQLSFLPAELPRVPGYEFYGAYEPARTVGGDYYGFIPLPGGRLGVVVADVAGKGVPGALLMVKLASDARLCLLTQDGPGAALRQLNNLLCANTRPTDRFVTLCLAVLDPAAHTVTLASAGQGSPLLYRQARHELSPAMPEDVPAKPLGLEEDQEFATCQVTLGVGDVLLLYTDGVLDQANAAHVAFGLHGVRAAALGPGGQTPRCIGERVHKAVRQHGEGRAAQVDDITLVCFGRVR